MTEKDVTDCLHAYFSESKYKLSNAYIFNYDWESDFFVQNSSGYTYEIEVKISRSDFFADMKKIKKHSILERGFYEVEHRGRVDSHVHKCRPNKFFYAVPSGLIQAKEVPPYAGLIYVNGFSFTKIKEAPFIHKDKMNFEDKLCNKFYYYWNDAKMKINRLENELKTIKENNILK